MLTFVLNPGRKKAKKPGLLGFGGSRRKTKSWRVSVWRPQKPSKRSVSSRRAWRARWKRGSAQAALKGLACRPEQETLKLLRSFKAKSCPEQTTYSSALPAHYARVANPSWVPAYAMNGRRRRHGRRRSSNPGVTSIGGLKSAVMSGFRPQALMSVLPVVGGVVGNTVLASVAKSWMPFAFLKTGPFSYAVNLATAGLMSAGVSMVRPQLAAGVLMGGVVQTLMDVAKQVVMPMVTGTVSGLGDYLSVADASRARSLGDYLSVGDVRGARPLGCIGNDCSGQASIAEDLLVGDSIPEGHEFQSNETSGQQITMDPIEVAATQDLAEAV